MFWSLIGQSTEEVRKNTGSACFNQLFVAHLPTLAAPLQAQKEPPEVVARNARGPNRSFSPFVGVSAWRFGSSACRCLISPSMFLLEVFYEQLLDLEIVINCLVKPLMRALFSNPILGAFCVRLFVQELLVNSVSQFWILLSSASFPVVSSSSSSSI